MVTTLSFQFYSQIMCNVNFTVELNHHPNPITGNQQQQQNKKEELPDAHSNESITQGH